VREDVLVPRKYGPLIERGMSLHEIKKHNRYEIMVMLKALERYHILKEGQQITAEMRRKDPNATLLYSQYLDEIDKYRNQIGEEDGDS